jgi:molecular chaperone HscB
MKRVDVVAVNLLECDLFELFSLSKEFYLDLERLDSKYFELQKKYHPDKYGADDISTHVTKSYQILKSPLLRAQYLLSLENIIVNSEDKDSIKPSPEMLEMILDAREELSLFKKKDEYENFRKEKTILKDQLITKISDNFLHKNYQEAASQTIHLRYVMKLLEEIK